MKGQAVAMVALGRTKVAFVRFKPDGPVHLIPSGLTDTVCGYSVSHQRPRLEQTPAYRELCRNCARSSFLGTWLNDSDKLVGT